MANPQQPELRRSGRNEALTPDAVRARVEATRPIEGDEHGHGPVPERNRAAGHPEEEQDKPDLDAFAEKLGIVGDHGHRDHDRSDHTPGTAEHGVEALAGRTDGDLPGLVIVGPPLVGPARRVAGLCTRAVLTPWVVVGRIAERTREHLLVRIEHPGDERPADRSPQLDP